MANNYKKFEAYAFEHGVHNGPSTRAALRNVYLDNKGSRWHTIVLLFKSAGVIMQQQDFEREIGCKKCIKAYNDRA